MVTFRHEGSFTRTRLLFTWTVFYLALRARFNIVLTTLVMTTSTVLTELLPACVTHTIKPFR